MGVGGSEPAAWKDQVSQQLQGAPHPQPGRCLLGKRLGAREHPCPPCLCTLPPRPGGVHTSADILASCSPSGDPEINQERRASQVKPKAETTRGAHDAPGEISIVAK